MKCCPKCNSINIDEIGGYFICIEYDEYESITQYYCNRCGYEWEY